MPIIKMHLPDESPKGRKRLANAKGFQTEDIKTGAKIVTQHYPDSKNAPSPNTAFTKFAFSGFGGAGIAIAPPGFFSPIHTPQNWQNPSKRKEMYQYARFYYDNEPKVAAGVDFYSQFPLNSFELECHNRKIKMYYEEVVRKLKLNYWLRLISHEYYLLGDVFPFLEIECPACGGKGTTKNGKPCNHPDGDFKSIIVLNPDFVEVEDSPFPDQRQISMVPDDTLKKIVQTREPKAVFDRIPDSIRALVSSGQKIPLSRRSVSHIKHSECPYGKYGTSMLRRLFTVLAYKTKLMTANWIVAERMILPVRVVKIGDKDRPAGPDDIADMQNQLTAVASEPNLTIVTHHAFEMDFIGATGKIHNIQGEWEIIGKEILDGLMLNQALLNGEMGGAANAQIGVETLLRRLVGWQNRLSEWVEEHIFKPIAMMKGFIDEKATKEIGKTMYLYPKMRWEDLALRDKTNKLQMFMQLHDQQLISTERLLEEFGIDADQELERLRNQAIMQPPQMPMGGPGGSPMAGAVGAPGGGMPPGDMGGGMPPPGGAPGGDAGGMGGAPGGAPAAGGAGGGVTAGSGAVPGKVYKKGKAPKEKEQEIIPPQRIPLTKIEQKIYKVLQELKVPFRVYAQYQQKMPGQAQPYIMDFALPDIQVDLESDGKIFHEKEGAPEKNAERDRKLAAAGWRVLRFNEDAINERINEVQTVIAQNIKEAADEHQQRKKAADAANIKVANTGDNSEENSIQFEQGSGQEEN